MRRARCDKISSSADESGQQQITRGEASENLHLRGINIDPSGHYLVASGEKSDRLSVYRIDQASGRLGEPTRYPVGKGANWIEMVEVK
jgi:6-phosphogluconolactonase (cycloisomerase 2 family)